MNKLRMSWAILSAVTLVAAAHAAKPPSIRDLAPEKTFFIVGVPSAAATQGRLKETSLWDLWKSQEFANFRTRMAEDFNEEMADVFAELGLDEDNFQMPSGEFGFAAFTITDPELQMPTFQFLVSADYGDDADKAQEIVDALLKKADEDEIERDEEDVLGRTMISIKLPQDEAGDGGMDDEFMMEDDPWNAGGGRSSPLDSIDTLYLIRDEGLFLLGSDQIALRNALERIDDEVAGPLDKSEELRGILAQVGSGQDVWGAMIFKHAGPLLMADPNMGMMAMVFPTLKQTIGDIQGLGFGSKLDGEHAMAESRMTVYMPNGKSGLTSLVTKATPLNEVPSFIPPNAISYSRINLNFGGLPEALRPVFAFAQMAMGGMQDPNAPPQKTPQQIAEQITACLGDSIHIAQTLERPITQQSVHQIMAIPCSDPKKLEQIITELSDGAMESQDFLGHRIFNIDANPMAMPGMGGMGGMDPETEPMALGLGGGFVFFGQKSSIEQSLRSIGKKDTPTLAGEPAYQRAMSALPGGNAVAWSYTDVLTMMEVQAKVLKLSHEQMVKDLREFDPDMARELEEENPFGDDPTMQFMLDADYDRLREYLGPSATDMQSTDDGFIIRVYQLGGSRTE